MAKQENLSQVNKTIKSIVVNKEAKTIRFDKVDQNVSPTLLTGVQEPDWLEDDEQSPSFVINKEKRTDLATHIFDLQENSDGSAGLFTADGLKEIKRKLAYFNDKLTFEHFKLNKYYDVTAIVKFNGVLYRAISPVFSKQTPNNSRLWKAITVLDFVVKECAKNGDRLSGLITALSEVYESVFIVNNLWDLYFISDSIVGPEDPKDLKLYISNTIDNTFEVTPSGRLFPITFQCSGLESIVLDIEPLESLSWEEDKEISLKIELMNVDNVLSTVYLLTVVHNPDDTITQRLEVLENQDGDLDPDLPVGDKIITENTETSLVNISYSNLNKAILTLILPSNQDMVDEEHFNPLCKITGLRLKKR